MIDEDEPDLLYCDGCEREITSKTCMFYVPEKEAFHDLPCVSNVYSINYSTRMVLDGIKPARLMPITRESAIWHQYVAKRRQEEDLEERLED